MPTSHIMTIGIILETVLSQVVFPKLRYCHNSRVDVDFCHPSSTEPPPAICRVLRRPERRIHPLDDTRVSHPSQIMVQMFLKRNNQPLISFLHNFIHLK